jgi:hypothetical protein
MMNRIASLLSSLAVAVLALTRTANLWRARGVDEHHSQELVPSMRSCWCRPVSRCDTERDCIA